MLAGLIMCAVEILIFPLVVGGGGLLSKVYATMLLHGLVIRSILIKTVLIVGFFVFIIKC